MAKVPIGKAPFTGIDLNDLPDIITGLPPMNSIVDDTTTAGQVYFCEAPAGVDSDEAGWRISRLTTATGETKWADGDTKYDNIADNRASLTYLFKPA